MPHTPSPFRPHAAFGALLIFAAAATLAQQPSIAHPPASAPKSAPQKSAGPLRSWRDYWRAVAAKSKAAEPDAAVMIQRLSHPLVMRPMPDGGPIGNKSLTAYFSGADSVISFPSYNLFGGLQRQSNCSLTEYLVTAQGNPTTQQTIPDYEQYLHTIAGLTTTVDKFPNGCDDPPSVGTLRQLVSGGKTTSGAHVGAYIGAFFPFSTVNTIHVPVVDNSGLISETDPIVGYDIGGLLAADFNGDGNLDLAVTDVANNDGSGAQISILIANGDGTYKTPTQISVTGYIEGLVSGDFNGDGKLDLIATVLKSAGDYQLLFFAGKGNGTFASPVVTDTGATELLVALPMKLTGSGALDIAGWSINSSEGDTSQLALLENNGSASFTPVLSNFPGQFISPISAGDLNGDGKIDLVVTSFDDDTATVLQGNGDGTFTPLNTFATVFTPTSSTIVDLDGDGNNDLFIGLAGNGNFGPVYSDAESSFGEALLGKGNFNFSVPAQLQPFNTGIFFSGYGSQRFAVANINGDSYQDAVISGGDGTNAIVNSFLGSSAGPLTNGSQITFSGLASIPTEASAVLLTPPLTTSAATDALILFGYDFSNSSTPALQTAVNNGSGTFTLTAAMDLPAPVVSAVAADFNGDGKTDLAFLTNDNNSSSADALYLALGNGNGTFQTPVVLNSAVSQGGSVYAGNLTGNGKQDLVVIQSTGFSTASKVLVYLNNGSGFSGSPTSFATPDGAALSGAVLADFNGDGKMDIGLLGTNGSTFASDFYLYTGNNSSTFTYAYTNLMGYDLGVTSGIALDVNHDGIVDLVVDGCCGDTWPGVLLGKGDGVLYPWQPLIVPTNAQGVQAMNFGGGSANYPGLLFGVGSTLVPMLNHYANAPTVAKAATTTIAQSPGTVAQGNSAYVSTKVVETSAAGEPTGTLTLTYGSVVLDTENVYSGGTYLTLTNTTAFPTGTYTLTVSYSGDNFNQPSSTTVSVKIIYATVTSFTISPLAVTAGDSVALTATVTRPNGTGYPTGYVGFFYGRDGLLASVKLVNGVAKLNASTAGFPTGIYQVQAGYDSDADDNYSSSATIPVTIVPKGLTGTTTALTYSPDPPTQGKNLSLTATVAKVSASGVPTGNVNFLYGTTLVATAPLNAQGQATISTPTTNYYPGNYDITAIYTGNSTTYKSSSAVTNIFLRYPSQTYVTVAPSTVTPGQSVSVTANVSGYGYSSPSGTVKLYANGAAFGTITLNGSGSGNFTASSSGIPAGSYNITGVYSGDTYYGGSNSPGTPVTVQ